MSGSNTFYGKSDLVSNRNYRPLEMFAHQQKTNLRKAQSYNMAPSIDEKTKKLKLLQIIDSGRRE